MDLLFDDPEDAPILAIAVQDAMAHMDSQMTLNLMYIIDQVPANAALLVIPRRDGIPHDADRQLWRDLQVQLANASTQSLDLLVVGDRRHWSAMRDSGDQVANRRSA